MKKLTVVLLILAASALAGTRADLRSDFRERTAERGDPAAADSTVNTWLNMAQQSVATLAGLLEKRWDTTFGGGYSFAPPSDIRKVKRVKIKSEGRWFDMRLYADSGMVPYDLTWDSATPTLFLDDNGYIQTYTDVTWSADSLSYTLPADFRRDLGAMHLSAGTWQSLAKNPLFVKDTSTGSYFVAQRAPDTAELFVKGSDWIPDGDTLRLFYLRGLKSGDSISVVYAGMPAEMTADSTECELLDDLETYVVDEAVRYYEMELKHYDVAGLLWNQIRQDLGIAIQ